MPGILAIWNDIAPDGYEHFERWYNREHLQERVGVPGFRFGRRYEVVSGGDRRFFAFYEVDSPDVLTSPAYMQRLENPTPWTQKTMTSFRNMVRTVCDLRRSEGDLAGSFAVVLRADGEFTPTTRLRMRWSMNWPRSPASRAFKSGRPPPARPRPIRQR